MLGCPAGDRSPNPCADFQILAWRPKPGGGGDLGRKPPSLGWEDPNLGKGGKANVGRRAGLKDESQGVNSLSGEGSHHLVPLSEHRTQGTEIRRRYSPCVSRRT
jgi:hypothetical protein